MTAKLVGDGMFYLNHAHDSWNGNGTLSCTEQTSDGRSLTLTRAVKITYNSSTGIGVNQSSVLRFQVDLVTSMKVSEIEILTDVFDSNGAQNPSAQWLVENGEVHMSALVTPLSDARVRASLIQGSLYIRGWPRD